MYCRFDTRKVGPAAVGPASFGKVVDCTFAMYTYVLAFKKNGCHLLSRCLGMFV